MGKLTQAGRGGSGVVEPITDPDQPYLLYGAESPTATSVFDGVSVNDMQAPVGVTSSQPIATTTPNGTTTLTTDYFRTQFFGRIVGTLYSNTAGTLYTQFSNDGKNWDVQVSDAITGTTTTSGGQSFSHEVVALYARFVYVPSASQGTFRFYPLLRRLGSA